MISFKTSFETASKFLQEFQHRENLSEMILDTIFSELFRLPEQRISTLFLCRLSMNLTTSETLKSFGQILNQGILTILARISELDEECIDRFAEFFTFMIS